jgi:pantoate--beta-alanine ligase
MSKTAFFRSAKAFRASLGPGSLGFVPTMGALHEGHLSLVRRAKRECRQVVVSIFVNPTQFGPKEDFKKYPRDLRGDRRLLDALAGIKIYAPLAEEVYPEGFASKILVGGTLGRRLEAAFRPGHFDGVATVVARLFGLVRPDKAYFGLKDYQQFQVIHRMVSDLNLNVELKGCATVREKDGLALSSRNRYLSPRERALAPKLYAALKAVRSAIQDGRGEAAALAEGRSLLDKARAFKIQYLALADAQTLGPSRRGWPQRVLVAAMLGKTRLIDNLQV